MKTCLVAVLAGSIALTLGTGAALACGGTQELFYDDFSFPDPSWGNYEGTTIADGVLTISVEPDLGYWLMNETSLYNDFDVCADVVQHLDDPTTGAGALLFWGADGDNYYTFDVATNGYYRVSRKQNGRWLTPVQWTLTENVVNPGEAVNQIRVLARGNVAIGFINGQQVVQFRGQPPAGGSYVGVYGDSPTGAGATFDFDNYTVTTADADLSAAQPMEQPPLPTEPPAPPAEEGTKLKSN